MLILLLSQACPCFYVQACPVSVSAYVCYDVHLRGNYDTVCCACARTFKYHLHNSRCWSVLHAAAVSSNYGKLVTAERAKGKQARPNLCFEAACWHSVGIRNTSMCDSYELTTVAALRCITKPALTSFASALTIDIPQVFWQCKMAACNFKTPALPVWIGAHLRTRYHM